MSELIIQFENKEWGKARAPNYLILWVSPNLQDQCRKIMEDFGNLCTSKVLMCIAEFSQKIIYAYQQACFKKTVIRRQNNIYPFYYLLLLYPDGW